MEDKKIDLKDPMVWIDLEMTGLTPENNQIIEIAVIVTDANDLETRYEGPNLIINCPQEILDGMDDWCTKHHGESGLTQSVIDSKITLADAEKQVIDFLQNTCNIKPRTAPFAGNSISTDRMFLYKEMKDLFNFLHYRIIDVSTMKQLCNWWYPEDFSKVPAKKECHRAKDDIIESIEELKYYQQAIMKSKA